MHPDVDIQAPKDAAPVKKEGAVREKELLIVDAVPPAVIDQLRLEFVLHHLWRAEDPNRLLSEVGPHVRGLVTNWQAGFSSELLDHLPRLEVISVYGTGTEKLDLDAAKARRIAVTNTELDGTDACVADVAIGFAIALARRIIPADRFVRDGLWSKCSFPPTTDFRDKTVGIVGLGFIGRQIAKRAQAFDTSVAYYDIASVSDEYRYFDDLPSLAKSSDFLFVSCRGGPEANGIINEAISYTSHRRVSMTRRR
jgi:lactate dehydrogenase-like 2-hydroxyacid dehydrogenase